jgi:hypothetical protein
MTDVMPEQQPLSLDELSGGEPAGTDGLDAVDEQLIARLAGRAREGGLALTGEGGLLAQLTKRLIESALDLPARPCSHRRVARDKWRWCRGCLVPQRHTSAPRVDSARSGCSWPVGQRRQRLVGTRRNATCAGRRQGRWQPRRRRRCGRWPWRRRWWQGRISSPDGVAERVDH